MDAFVVLAMSLGLLAVVMGGVLLTWFLMMVAVGLSLVCQGLPRGQRPAVVIPRHRVVPPIPFPRRRTDWGDGRAAWGNRAASGGPRP